MNKFPFITIITVVFNSVTNIEETIKSVICGITNECEYIVIDGGSTDGTISIIKKYEKFISYWISEPDSGIYNAINKAIKKARGNFIYIINCGDTLIKLPLDSISKNQDFDLLCYPVKLSSGNVFYPTANFTLKIRNTLPHQGCLYKINEDFNFDERYKVFADFDLNQKYFKNKKKIKTFTIPIIARHETDGLSHNERYSYEIFKVVRNNFGLAGQVVSLIYFKYSGLLKRIKRYIW